MRKRNLRQETIKNIVRRERVRTQRDLVEHLKAEGFACTQATVSRDIADMGLRKVPDGVYVLAEDMHLQRMVSELVETVGRSEQLVLIKTTAGGGQSVAAALDAADLPGILGSIAGDDTILVVGANQRQAENLVTSIEKFRGQK